MQQTAFVPGDTVEDYLHEYGISYELMASFLKECGFEPIDKKRWENVIIYLEESCKGCAWLWRYAEKRIL